MAIDDSEFNLAAQDHSRKKDREREHVLQQLEPNKRVLALKKQIQAQIGKLVEQQGKDVIRVNLTPEQVRLINPDWEGIGAEVEIEHKEGLEDSVHIFPSSTDSKYRPPEVFHLNGTDNYSRAKGAHIRMNVPQNRGDPIDENLKRELNSYTQLNNAIVVVTGRLQGALHTGKQNGRKV